MSGSEVRGDRAGSVEPIVPHEGESVGRGEKLVGVGIEGPYVQMRRSGQGDDYQERTMIKMQRSKVNGNYFKLAGHGERMFPQLPNVTLGIREVYHSALIQYELLAHTFGTRHPLSDKRDCALRDSPATGYCVAISPRRSKVI